MESKEYTKEDIKRHLRLIKARLDNPESKDFEYEIKLILELLIQNLIDGDNINNGK